MYDWVLQRKRDYGGSLRRYAEHLYETIARDLSTEGVAEMVHEGFDPTVAAQEPLVNAAVSVTEAILVADRSSWMAFADVLSPLGRKCVGETVDELKDGFTNGVDGVFAWFQANATRHYMKTLPQVQAMMKVGPIVFVLRTEYTKYQAS